MSNKKRTKFKTQAGGEMPEGAILPEDIEASNDLQDRHVDDVDTSDEAVERIIGEKPEYIFCEEKQKRCFPEYEVTNLDGSKRLACKECVGVGTDRKGLRKL